MTWVAVWIGSSIAFLVGIFVGHWSGYPSGCRDGARISREIVRVLDDWRILHRPKPHIGHSIPGDSIIPGYTSPDNH